MTRLEVRAFAPGDLPGIQRLFQRAYGSELRAEEWEWKYGRSPFEHFGVVGERQGEVVAYYGGWRWRLHGAGERRDALVFCDIMTDPSARMAGRLPPLIPLHEAAMGLASAAGIPYFCGFPNRGAARFGSRFLGYRYEWMAACSAPLPTLTVRPRTASTWRSPTRSRRRSTRSPAGSTPSPASAWSGRAPSSTGATTHAPSVTTASTRCSPGERRRRTPSPRRRGPSRSSSTCSRGSPARERGSTRSSPPSPATWRRGGSPSCGSA
ncbi:MAG: GNAT family N-acetyltransferase [Holophagales bacterium]|nr:GNAT family N-acetyltransferase [Holophagales bacterium]